MGAHEKMIAASNYEVDIRQRLMLLLQYKYKRFWFLWLSLQTYKIKSFLEESELILISDADFISPLFWK